MQTFSKAKSDEFELMFLKKKKLFYIVRYLNHVQVTWIKDC